MNIPEKAITSSDKTFISLREELVKGRVKAGSKLNESELSTKFGVSRAVIREVINRLERTNLVERTANIGARVVTISPKGLIELYQVRESLEGMAARLAATNMQQHEIEALQSLLKQHEQGVEAEQSYYQEAGDVDFHYRIVLGSHNECLISMLINSIYHLVRMYRVQLGMAGPRVGRAFKEHQQVLEAISNRDPELAELLMRRHIAYSMNHIKAKLEDSL